MQASGLGHLPANTNGSVDLNAWVEGLCRDRPHLNKAHILPAAERLRDGFNGDQLRHGLELAELVAAMQMDTTSLLTALFYRPARRGAIYGDDLVAAIGKPAAELFNAVNGMADISLLDLTSSRMLASEAKDQTANIRRMLVALIDDVRVAVLKLAERVVALRFAKNSFEERKTRIATEAMTVFVPLADRLGIWHLKWELEDLSLRYLEPDAYARIARQLYRRRADREARVIAIVGGLKTMLGRQGITADVRGRAKHIYSIWRKMRTKQIPFEEVHDVLGVRIIVADEGQCYAARDLIHGRWGHKPEEFDNYVAKPKENGYQSLHTTVIDDAGDIFEVQIRTQEMHDDAEFGVCAHWTYKGADMEDEFYAEKITRLRGRLRKMLDWQYGLGGTLANQLTEKVREQRIFVHTPQGHVVDLLAGATPIDFAYRVHTEIGHHCSGVRVDGQRVPLNTPLKSGQLVQIHKDPGASPRRAWLDPNLGYARTARAKSKIRSWLRGRERAVNVAGGRRAFDEMTDCLGLPRCTSEQAGALVAAFELDSPEALFFALGVADLLVLDVVYRYLDLTDPSGSSAWLPGFTPGNGYEHCRLEIQAENRDGLWRDITVILSARGLSLVANSGRVDPATGTAWLTLELESSSLYEVARLINQLRHVQDVRAVRRVLDGA